MEKDITLIKTDSKHLEFVKLVDSLDKELAVRDGDEHDFYHQFNGIDHLYHVVLAFNDNIAVGCGAFKVFNAESVEIKRMYTSSNFRGLKIASKVLAKLENWAFSLGYKRCILETGINQPEAIALYYKSGYSRIANYAQYKNKKMSRCFEKELIGIQT